MLGVVLGGRIGYLLFYGWTQMLSDPLYIFRVWEGGMSFHGGFFGVIIASYIYGRRTALGLTGCWIGGCGNARGPWPRAAGQFHQWRTLWPGNRCALGLCVSQ